MKKNPNLLILRDNDGYRVDLVYDGDGFILRADDDDSGVQIRLGAVEILNMATWVLSRMGS